VDQLLQERQDDEDDEDDEFDMFYDQYNAKLEESRNWRKQFESNHPNHQEEQQDLLARQERDAEVRRQELELWLQREKEAMENESRKEMELKRMDAIKAKAAAEILEQKRAEFFAAEKRKKEEDAIKKEEQKERELKQKEAEALKKAEEEFERQRKVKIAAEARARRKREEDEIKKQQQEYQRQQQQQANEQQERRQKEEEEFKRRREEFRRRQEEEDEEENNGYTWYTRLFGKPSSTQSNRTNRNSNPNRNATPPPQSRQQSNANFHEPNATNTGSSWYGHSTRKQNPRQTHTNHSRPDTNYYSEPLNYDDLPENPNLPTLDEIINEQLLILKNKLAPNIANCKTLQELNIVRRIKDFVQSPTKREYYHMSRKLHPDKIGDLTPECKLLAEELNKVLNNLYAALLK
jgi:hypothetical protein